MYIEHKRWMKEMLNEHGRQGGWEADRAAGTTTATVWVSHRLGTKVWSCVLNFDIKYQLPWNTKETVKEFCTKF